MKPEQDNNKKKSNMIRENQKVYKEVAPYLDLGLQLALTIGVFVTLGWWLDKKFSLTPTLTLIFIFLGIFIGFFNFFRSINNKNPDK